VRVIGGKYKGHQLVAFKGKHIRPTTDRVKETVFNKLMFELSEARVLDLFAGTGSLSIEACSRGAISVDIVESHPGSLKIIEANLRKIGIEKEVKVFSRDVFKYIKSYQGEAYDIIFIDPPFTKKIAHEVMLALADSRCLFGPLTKVVVEATVHERMDDVYKSLSQYDKRHFGDKSVFFFSPH